MFYITRFMSLLVGMAITAPIRIVVSQNDNRLAYWISPDAPLEAAVQDACTHWRLERSEWEFKISKIIGEHTLTDGNTDTARTLGLEAFVQMWINGSRR